MLGWEKPLKSEWDLPYSNHHGFRWSALAETSGQAGAQKPV